MKNRDICCGITGSGLTNPANFPTVVFKKDDKSLEVGVTESGSAEFERDVSNGGVKIVTSKLKRRHFKIRVFRGIATGPFQTVNSYKFFKKLNEFSNGDPTITITEYGY